MKNFFYFSLLLIGLLGGIFLTQNLVNSSSKSAAVKQELIKQVGLPIRITIPKINVDTTIESIDKDAQGNMDVPKDFNNVGWYNLGYRPGQHGNAVIAGHLDSATGPAIFSRLAELSPKDVFIVSTNKNEKIKFMVTGKETFDESQFPKEKIFGPASLAKLNLITCQGEFNTQTNHYSERIVIYAERINY